MPFLASEKGNSATPRFLRKEMCTSFIFKEEKLPLLPLQEGKSASPRCSFLEKGEMPFLTSQEGTIASLLNKENMPPQ